MLSLGLGLAALSCQQLQCLLLAAAARLLKIHVLLHKVCVVLGLVVNSEFLQVRVPLHNLHEVLLCLLLDLVDGFGHVGGQAVVLKPERHRHLQVDWKSHLDVEADDLLSVHVDEGQVDLRVEALLIHGWLERHDSAWVFKRELRINRRWVLLTVAYVDN